MKVNKKWTLLVVVAGVVGLVIGRGSVGSNDSSTGQNHAETEEAAIEFWTCSMHPEIKLPEAGQCPKCAMDLIPVMKSDNDEDSMGLRELKLSPSAQALAEVETAMVEKRFATAEIRMVGKVDYDETRLAYLTAWVPGRLDRLFVDYTGVEVKKGDHMVSLYSPELISAQEELIQALETVKSLKDSDISLIKDRVASSVESSREKLRLWGLSRKQIDEIEERGTPEDHLTVNSPIGGVVLHKNAQEGMYVTTGTRIYTIADLSRVWVQLDAYESDLAWLRYGQDVEFETESYPGRPFHGTIAFIDPILNNKTRTVNVRVNVDNAQGDLKPGMFVRATVRSNVAAGGRVFSSNLAGKWISPMHPEIVKDEPGECDVCGMALVSAESLGYVLGEIEDAPLVIPVTAPLITGKRAIVYLKVPDRPGVFEGREIVLGPRAGDYYLVRRGLSEGEMVVTKGNFKLDAELQIYAKPSMMTPGGGGGGGGHDHGGSTPAKDGEKPSMPGMGLSSLAQSQLHAVLAAAKAADQAVQGEDLAQVRTAFAELKDSVETVEADQFKDHSALLWKEYAMFLGNDGEEGATIDTLPQARDLLALLSEHTASMQKAMGLAHGQHSEAKPSINSEFLEQLGSVVSAYLILQDELVKSDPEKASTSVVSALTALDKVDMTLVTGEDHMDWMKHAGNLKTGLSAIAKEEALADMRKAFSPLSDDMMATIQRFGSPAERLYQFRCPMALGGEGATWIQGDKETRNPYYGDSMLKCGSVIDTLAGPAKEEAHNHE